MRSYVYLIGAGRTGHVKIGHSNDPQARLRSIQTGSALPLSVLATFEGGQPLEASLHRWFAPRRMQGEWFDFGELDAVATVTDAIEAATAAPAVTASPLRRKAPPTGVAYNIIDEALVEHMPDWFADRDQLTLHELTRHALSLPELAEHLHDDPDGPEPFRAMKRVRSALVMLNGDGVKLPRPPRDEVGDIVIRRRDVEAAIGSYEATPEVRAYRRWQVKITKWRAQYA